MDTLKAIRKSVEMDGGGICLYSFIPTPIIEKHLEDTELKDELLGAEEDIRVAISNLPDEKRNIIEGLIKNENGIVEQVKQAENMYGGYARSATASYCEINGIVPNQEIYNFFFDFAYVNGRPMQANFVLDPEGSSDIPLEQCIFRHFDAFPNDGLKIRALGMLSAIKDFSKTDEVRTPDKEQILANQLKAVGINPALALAFLDEAPDKRYYGAINYKLGSHENRFFVFDTLIGEIHTAKCSHCVLSSNPFDDRYMYLHSFRHGYTCLGFAKVEDRSLVFPNCTRRFCPDDKIETGGHEVIKIEFKDYEKLLPKLEGSVVLSHG